MQGEEGAEEGVGGGSRLQDKIKWTLKSTRWKDALTRCLLSERSMRQTLRLNSRPPITEDVAECHRVVH